MDIYEEDVHVGTSAENCWEVVRVDRWIIYCLMTITVMFVDHCKSFFLTWNLTFMDV